jgi:trehalose 6-phosphate synthase
MPEKSRSDVPWNGAYHKVNEMFADTIVPYVEDGDVIWIHDYHLLLLPAVLRKRLRHRKNVKIGLFLHTPFPTEDYFSILPFREAICHGLLNCDLVGFHVDEYAKDFLDSATRVLEGVERSPSDLHYEGRKLVVHSFPIGIDPEEFKQRMESEATQREIEALEKEFVGKKILIGVDRLDYSKGIPQKLLAYDKFLTDNPEWTGRVVLIQLAIPTRPNVKEYIKLRREVESLVGNINGKHGKSLNVSSKAPRSPSTSKEHLPTPPFSTCTKLFRQKSSAPSTRSQTHA